MTVQTAARRPEQTDTSVEPTYPQYIDDDWSAGSSTDLDVYKIDEIEKNKETWLLLFQNAPYGTTVERKFDIFDIQLAVQYLKIDSGLNFTGSIIKETGNQSAAWVENSNIISTPNSISHIDEAMSDIRSFRLLKDNWDGDGALAPKDDMIQSALSILRLWKPKKGILDISITDDGYPVINIMSENEDILGSIDFIGGGKFIFCLIGRGKIEKSGEGDTYTPADREMLFRNLEVHTTGGH